MLREQDKAGRDQALTTVSLVHFLTLELTEIILKGGGGGGNACQLLPNGKSAAPALLPVNQFFQLAAD